MSYKTILSNDIKVYPSGFRTNNPENGVWIDPEARLNTEFNISHSGGSIKGKNSYVISNVLSNNIYYVECVIHGYYFNFNVAASTLMDLGSTSELKTIYAKIKIGTTSILDDDTNFLTEKLIPFTGDDYDSKDQVSGSYYFQALILSNETSSDANIISLPLWTIFWAEGRGDYIIRNIQASFFTETATHIESEDSSIPITNRLVNGAGNGAVKAISAEEASGLNSIALGTGTKATIEGSFAIGKYNIGGKLFEVGYGNNSSQRKDLFSIDTAGKTDLIGQFDVKDSNNNSTVSINNDYKVVAAYKLLVDNQVDDSSFWQGYSSGSQEPTLEVNPDATNNNPKIIMRGKTEIYGNTLIDGTVNIRGQYLTIDSTSAEIDALAEFYGNSNFYGSATFKDDIILPKINKIKFGSACGNADNSIYIDSYGYIQPCNNTILKTSVIGTLAESGWMSGSATTLPNTIVNWSNYAWSDIVVLNNKTIDSTNNKKYNYYKITAYGPTAGEKCWELLDISKILQKFNDQGTNIQILDASTMTVLNTAAVPYHTDLEIGIWHGSLTISGANHYFVGFHGQRAGILGLISIELITKEDL